MKVSQNCIDLIKKWEGCKLTAYKCPAGVWTIGIGTTCYPDGRRVREGDKITDQQAEGFLVNECEEKAKADAEAKERAAEEARASSAKQAAEEAAQKKAEAKQASSAEQASSQQR